MKTEKMEPCRHERSRFIQIHDVSVEVCCFCAATVVDPEPKKVTA
jgi:hypothetical protein